MPLILLARKAALVVLGIALAGCAKEDGSRILGKWRTERIDMMSLKLPVGPELEIKPNELAMGSAIHIPIAAITQDGDEVTLDTDSLIGMSFYFVDDDRMYIDLPVVGQIYYRRVKDLGTVLAAPQAPAEHVPQAPVAPAPPVKPLPAAALPTTAAYLQEYEQARMLVRQGDHDNALRSLHAAFQQGFRGTALLDSTPEFGVLKKDVRYQALLARYAGQ